MRKVVQLRGLLVQHHLIIDGDDIHLIDGGFIRGIPRIKKALAQIGKEFSDIRSIILSHGHLDHTRNIAKLQKLTHCPVFAPQKDRHHLNGQHPSRGLARIGAWLESLGRLLLIFQKPKIDHWFNDGDHIMGLKVIALPGHTDGHCGFLLPEEKLLLAGDLFTNHFGKTSIPPQIFNDDHTIAQQSIHKAAAMDLEGIFLNHTWKTTPKKALIALINLANDL